MFIYTSLNKEHIFSVAFDLIHSFGLFDSFIWIQLGWYVIPVQYLKVSSFYNQ